MCVNTYRVINHDMVRRRSATAIVRDDRVIIFIIIILFVSA